MRIKVLLQARGTWGPVRVTISFLWLCIVLSIDGRTPILRFTDIILLCGAEARSSNMLIGSDRCRTIGARSNWYGQHTSERSCCTFGLMNAALRAIFGWSGTLFRVPSTRSAQSGIVVLMICNSLRGAVKPLGVMTCGRGGTDLSWAVRPLG